MYSLCAVGICGEGIVFTHNDGPCITPGIGETVGFCHEVKCICNGCGIIRILHCIPEGCFVHIVADEGNALGITVNNACTCAEKRITGGALTLAFHAFADRHPNKAVGKGVGCMVFNVTAVNESCAAGANCPTVVVVFLSDAAVGGQAEVGRSTGLGAVAVENNNALIREIFCDCGAGCRSALDKQVFAAGCCRNGLCFTLILIGEAAVVAVVRRNEEYVGGFCILKSALFAAAFGENNAFLNGCAVGVEFVAEPVVVCAIHAVNGEVEAVLREVGEAVLINGVEVQCSVVNCIDNLGAAHALSKSVCFGCIECRPSVVEFAHGCCFVNETVNILCKRSNGNHCESHDERKRKCQKFAGFHFFSS